MRALESDPARRGDPYRRGYGGVEVCQVQARHDGRLGRIDYEFGNAVFAINAQLEMFDGTIEDVCLRGLTILPEGGTSKAVLKHIEQNVFAYSRRILVLWQQESEKMQPGSWAAAGGPSPENIGLHRLCEDTVLMTDTCNGARCTKRMCADTARTVV
jgi:hypothetical protein